MGMSRTLTTYCRATTHSSCNLAGWKKYSPSHPASLTSVPETSRIGQSFRKVRSQESQMSDMQVDAIPKSAKSTNFDYKIKIVREFDCNTNVINPIQCNQCCQQYISQNMASFRTRFNNRKLDVAKKPNLPILCHVSRPGQSINDTLVFILQFFLHNGATNSATRIFSTNSNVRLMKTLAPFPQSVTCIPKLLKYVHWLLSSLFPEGPAMHG